MGSGLNWLIPVYAKSNKRYLTLAIGCTGGRHRSVALNRVPGGEPEEEPVRARVSD
ncbi:RapZ C-terminal domain-containing protein [Escherichia coli]|uniref:RapZ C-terminal domain-containing protein n=1 Tax=Escherichia coli TaxID=562 RepID=UPI0033148804